MRTACLAVLVVAAGSAWADPPSPSPGLSFSSSVDVVRVTLTVTDKAGNAVPAVGIDEIELREDGRPQQIRFLAHTQDSGAVSALDLSVAMLLDVSQSMAGASKLSRDAAFRFLDAVPRAKQLHVVLFGKHLVGVPYTPETRDAIRQAIADVPPEGGTPLFDAVEAAVGWLDKEGGRRVLVLLSDGEECGSRLGFQGLMRFLRASDATVHAIDFSTPQSPTGATRVSRCPPASPLTLRDIARTTGGTLNRAGGPNDVPEILERILVDLRSQYVIGYVSDAPRQDGRYRKLEVRLRRHDLSVRHKAGYTAKGGSP